MSTAIPTQTPLLDARSAHIPAAPSTFPRTYVTRYRTHPLLPPAILLQQRPPATALKSRHEAAFSSGHRPTVIAKVQTLWYASKTAEHGARKLIWTISSTSNGEHVGHSLRCLRRGSLVSRHVGSFPVRRGLSGPHLPKQRAAASSVQAAGSSGVTGLDVLCRLRPRSSIQPPVVDVGRSGSCQR